MRVFVISQMIISLAISGIGLGSLFGVISEVNWAGGPWLALVAAGVVNAGIVVLIIDRFGAQAMHLSFFQISQQLVGRMVGQKQNKKGE